MRRLVIRNVGPIKDVDLNLNRVNVFIGPQSSGKSTLAKVLSTCSWVEKEVTTTMEIQPVADRDAFLSLLEVFHKMNGYFDDESEVLFETDFIRILFKEMTPDIQLKDSKAYRREKICYIPSERNVVTLPELQGIEFGQTDLRSFLSDWYKAREYFSEDNKTDILDLGVRYYYNPDDKKYKDQIEHSNGNTYRIPLGSASSGLQSVIPLLVMIQFFSEAYFVFFREKVSFDTEDKNRLIQRKLTDAIVLKQLFPGQFDLTDRSTLIRRANDLLHSGDETAIRLLREYRTELDRLTIPIRTSFIIEEPEQNLFPKTQMNLLYYLVSKLNDQKEHRLVITTHSPYFLYALNNCMLSFLVKDRIDKELVPDIECLGFSLDPTDVSVWSIRDGYVKNDKGDLNATIQDDRGLIRKNYFNDVMKEVMGEFNTLLSFLE